MTDMSGQDRLRDRLHDRLCAELVTDLAPVRRLRSPWLRAAVWIGLVLAVAAVLSSDANLASLHERLARIPDMWLALLGSALTACLAAVACFQLSLPDRSPAWGALPLPGLALWLGASGMGCARAWFLPWTVIPSWSEERSCVVFILGLSIPLSLVIIAMLRRGYALYPSLTATVAGLAVAAAAATLLNLFHPYDVAIDDLITHGCAVAIVIAANRLCGNTLLRRRGAVRMPG